LFSPFAPAFVEVTPNFPEECRFVLESFREVYVNDALAREQNMTPEERLAFHQTHSGPVMEQVKVWLKAQFEEKKVEPNSGRSNAQLRAWIPARVNVIPLAPNTGLLAHVSTWCGRALLKKHWCKLCLRKALLEDVGIRGE
jgi:hypothetical protein